MYTFLYDFDSPPKEGLYHKYLSNGERLLERQFRMLANQELFEVKIAGSRRLFEYCKDVIKKRRDFRRFQIEYIGKGIQPELLKDFREEYLFLAYNLLYSAEDFNLFLKNSAKYGIAALPHTAKRYHGLTARLDMDWIIDLGTDLKGLDVCPVLPMIKINGALLEETDIYPDSFQLDCSSGKNFLSGIIKTLSPCVKGFLWYADQQGIRLAEEENGEEILSGYMEKQDFLSRKIIAGQGYAVYIKDIVKQYQAEHVLLACDDSIERTCLKELFQLQGLQYKTIFISNEKAAEESIQELESILQKENIDMILAIGSNDMLNLVQKARKNSCENSKTAFPEIKLVAIPSTLERRRQYEADAQIYDANIILSSFGKALDTTPIKLLQYRLLCALCFKKMGSQKQEDVKNLLSDLAQVNTRYLVEDGQKLQEALNFCHMADYFNTFYASGLEDIPEIIGQAAGISPQTAASVLLPFWLKRFYAAVSRDVSKNGEWEKFAVSIGRQIGFRYEISFEENLASYSQNLVNQGVQFGKDFYASCYGQVMEQIGQKIDLSKISFFTMEDLENIVLDVLSYKNTNLKPVIKNVQLEEDGEEKESPHISLKTRIIQKIKKSKLIRLVSAVLKNIRYILYQMIYPVQMKWIVFESYGGTNNFGCNTRAIYEAMLTDPDYFDYKYIWAFNDPKKFKFLEKNTNTILVKRGSVRYIKFCARSRYIFSNTGMPRYVKPNKQQKMIYTWHGKPLKRIGCSFKGDSEGKRSKRQMLRDYTGAGKRLTILTSPSPIFTPIMADAYNLSPKKRQTAMLETGYPRNDFLFRYTKEDVLRIKMNLKVPFDKKVILYAPTWRPFHWISGKKFEHEAVLDLKKLHQELGDDYVFLFRLHHLERDSMHFDQYPGFLYDVSMVQDVNELYIISDMLISDYSGTVFDFANLCRPIVFFMHDKDEYTGEANGLNFDLDFLPGVITETQEEMTNAIKDQMEHFVYDDKYKKFNELCNGLDGPDCALRTAHQIVEVNPEISAKQTVQKKCRTFIWNTMMSLWGYLHKLPLIKSGNTRKIESFHNKYKGRRCFLIGNGPSLRLEDLNRLKGEICFGCNMIYKVFERTEWRPAFLCVSDRVVAQAVSEQLQSCPQSILWASRTAYHLMKYKGDGLIYVTNLNKEKFFVHGNMAEYYVPSRATVMTFMVELAMYMGFSKIYMLGVDFTIGRSKNDHFMNSYRDQEMTLLERKKMRNMFRGEDIGVHEAQVRLESRALYAYEQLEKYAKKHGYHVYNATRGGMLEVFERADLDEVLAEKSKEKEKEYENI